MRDLNLGLGKRWEMELDWIDMAVVMWSLMGLLQEAMEPSSWAVAADMPLECMRCLVRVQRRVGGLGAELDIAWRRDPGANAVGLAQHETSLGDVWNLGGPWMLILLPMLYRLFAP